MSTPCTIQRLKVSPTPLAVAAALRTRAGFVWLDSAAGTSPQGRWSILACEPRESLQLSANRHAPKQLQSFLHECGFGSIQKTMTHTLPFTGGLIGYLSYDFGRQMLERPLPEQPSSALPEVVLCYYEAAYVYDHVADCGWCVGEANWLRDAVNAPNQPPPIENLSAEVEQAVSQADYVAAVLEAKADIARGELYQVNLAQKFTLPQPPAWWALAQKLRSVNPGNYAAVLALRSHTVLSCSPEQLFSIRGKGITTRPIKGTRPRGIDPTEDARQQAALLASDKERAELLMITDLARNDLGRVCEFGSVCVNQLYALESYSTVHHLVAEVQGELTEAVTYYDVLQAMFPGGSITGAPKLRAMQLIDQLEPMPRGLFCGSVGYLSHSGCADFNICIRTLIHTPEMAWFHAGSGIVWDSDPLSEYQETLAKARGITQAFASGHVD